MVAKIDEREKRPPRATVYISGCEYIVQVDDDPIARVTKERSCSCGLADCKHVKAVKEYLKAGGPRAPSPPISLTNCPVCGGKITADRTWTDRDGAGRRVPGWRCERGGLRHFLQAKAERVKKRLAEKPWVFPPVYDESGACVYPGVRREEIMTWKQCQAINRRIYLETGYDSAA